jgi:hypothetical protein
VTALIWTRTSRHTNTLDEEIDELRRSISQHSSYQWRSRDDVSPFVGDDHLLFGLDSEIKSLRELRAVLSPALTKTFITDWSITEVGTGVGPMFEGDTRSTDDRFLASDLVEDEEFYFDDVDPAEQAQTQAASSVFLSRLRWRLDYDCRGASCLWIDLARDRANRDPVVGAVMKLLPHPVHLFWQGRSSIAIGYNSGHDLRRDGAFGLEDELRDLLDESDEVRDYLAFQVGTQSVSMGGDLMNPMLDFIIANHRNTQRHRPGSAPRRQKSSISNSQPGNAPRRVIVERRVTRPLAVKRGET